MGNGVVVGIAGGSGSGKTTLTNLLVAQLAGVEVRALHMDSYFLFGTGRMPRHVGPLSGLDYEDHNHPNCFDLPRFYSDIDKALASEAAVVIIEGLLILQDEWVKSKLDLRIFVDAPADERMYRRIKRFMGYGQSMEEAARFYLDSVRFRHEEFVEPSRWHADLVVNSSRTTDRAVELVAGWVRQRAAL
jgi:uridine kinase